MVFALIWEKIFFGTTPKWTSWIGILLILGAMIWVVIYKEKERAAGKVLPKVVGSTVATRDEERGLVGRSGDDEADMDTSDEDEVLDDDEQHILEVDQNIELHRLTTQ